MRSTVLSSVLSLSVVALAACSGNAAGGTESSSAETLPTEGSNTTPTQDTNDTTVTTPANPSDGSAPNGDGTDAGDGTGNGGNGDDAGDTDAGTDPVTDPAGDPGPKPTATCQVTKDSSGFFVRNSGKSSYVAYVPASYSADKPMRLIVGLHGCGDTAMNFATWGVNPFQTRTTQDHIGISVDGATGGGSCWSIGGDDDKVLAAVDDISKCFWVHQKKVTVAGYSSGGQLAYRVGLKNASRFAGIIIENSGLYAADSNPDSLLANASRKIPVAHRAHQNDSVFALSKVQADWAKLTAAGFPLKSDVVAGDHSGTNVDWAEFLIPASKDWFAP